MTRDTAYQILTKHLSNKTLLAHSLAVEAVMQALSVKFKDDPEMWGIAGLLHDADYEKAKGNPDKHGYLLFELEPNTIPSIIEHAIKAHNFEETHVAPESPMDFALYCCDELTGIIAAVAWGTKDKKLAGVTTEVILEKLKDKDFAKGAKKEKIYLCEDKLGIPLDQFVSLTLKAMQAIHEQLGL